MSEHTARQCGTCRFWVVGTNQPRHAASFTSDGGECRKNPPRGGQFNVYQEAREEGENLNKVSIVCFPFPPTHRLDWCGKWSERYDHPDSVSSQKDPL